LSRHAGNRLAAAPAPGAACGHKCVILLKEAEVGTASAWKRQVASRGLVPGAEPRTESKLN